MENSNIGNDEISKTIIRRYIPAVILIVILIIARQLIIQYQLSQDEHLSKIINVAGRQRALSQVISKDAYALSIYKDKDTINLLLSELKVSTDIWKKSNIDLKTQNHDEGLQGSNSVKALELYELIERNHQDVLKAAYDIINLVESGSYSKNLLEENVKIISRNEGPYLKGMNNIVNQYELEFVNKFDYFTKLEMALFLIILIVILFEILYIFLPARKSLTKAFREIEESRENMLSLFKTAHGAMFLIDQETENVLLMNKQAEEIAHINRIGDKLASFNDILKCDANKSCDIMERIKTNEKNQNVEVTLRGNEGKDIIVLLSSEKMCFSKRASILIELFDITMLKQAEETLKNIAITDGLTGLYNRHFLDIKIKEEIDRSDRFNEPISMVIFDLDHFKRVNDTWGHPTGDEVLKQTAEIASSVIRKTDTLFRVGGEEFLVLMPQTSKSGAMMVAEKIRETIQNNTHPTVGKYTASFGVAEKVKAELFNNWYKRADEALYHAKEGGRNCVVSYTDKESLPLAQVHLEWKAEWESGNQDIDLQHRELIDIANSLIYMALSSVEIDKTANKLDMLIKHTIYHFDFEEHVLENIKYPDLLEHSKIHKQLVEKTLKLKEAFQNKELKASAVFSFVVDDVIIGHMLDADVQFFKYIPK